LSLVVFLTHPIELIANLLSVWWNWQTRRTQKPSGEFPLTP
jgi:hypothetical protein